jgi:hypothetical protein
MSPGVMRVLTWLGALAARFVRAVTNAGYAWYAGI